MTNTLNAKSWTLTKGADGRYYSDATRAPSTTLTLNQFVRVSDSPASAPIPTNEWSCGESRIVVDPVTNDLLAFFNDDSTAIVYGIISTDYGESWTELGSKTLGSITFQMTSLGIDSKGDIHCIAYRNSSSPHNYYYFRLSLTRSGGHVTDFSVAQAPFAFVDHSMVNTNEPRGDLKIVSIGGNERILYCFNSAQTSGPNTDVQVYGGMSTTSAQASLSDFVAIDGSAGDTQLYNNTGNSNRNNHYLQMLWVQERSTEDCYLILGKMDADHRVPVSSSTDYNLVARRYTVSGDTLVYDSDIVLATDDGVAPMILGVASTATKAWVMYLHPTLGVSFGYLADGVWHDQAAPPLDVGDRAAFGAFSVDDAGHIWCGYHTFYNNADQQIHGAMAFWDGEAWSSTDFTGLHDCCCFAGSVDWKYGCAILRFTGAKLPVSTTTDLDIATIYGGVP